MLCVHVVFAFFGMVAVIRASEINSTLWRKSYVSKKDVDNAGGKKEIFSTASKIRCSGIAMTRNWTNLFCILDGQCVLTELLRLPFQDPAEGPPDPIKCHTRVNTDELEPCTKNEKMGYPGFGCLKVVDAKDLTWPEARQSCIAIGMDLVNFEYVTSEEQLEAVEDELDLSGSSDYWVGFKMNAAGKEHEWISGTPLPTDSPFWKDVPDLQIGSFGIMKGLEYEEVEPLDDADYSLCSYP